MKWEGETSQLHPNRPYSQILVQENNGAEDGSAKRSLSSSSRDFPETSFALDLFLNSVTLLAKLFHSFYSFTISIRRYPFAANSTPFPYRSSYNPTARYPFLTLRRQSLPGFKPVNKPPCPASLPKSYPQWWSQTSMNTCVKKRRD